MRSLQWTEMSFFYESIVFVGCQRVWHAERNTVVPLLSTCLSAMLYLDECRYRKLIPLSVTNTALVFEPNAVTKCQGDPLNKSVKHLGWERFAIFDRNCLDR